MYPSSTDFKRPPGDAFCEALCIRPCPKPGPFLSQLQLIIARFQTLNLVLEMRCRPMNGSCLKPGGPSRSPRFRPWTGTTTRGAHRLLRKAFKRATRRAEALNRLYDTDRAKLSHSVWFVQEHRAWLPLVKVVERIVAQQETLNKIIRTAIQLCSVQKRVLLRWWPTQSCQYFFRAGRPCDKRRVL